MIYFTERRILMPLKGCMGINITFNLTFDLAITAGCDVDDLKISPKGLGFDISRTQ